MENNFKREDLAIAGIRYYDHENNGIELSDNLSYVVLARVGEGKDARYFNIFDITESYPVFERSKCYANYTIDGEAFGTKMIYRGGYLESGPCYVLEEQLPEEIFDDVVSKEELEDYILKTERYFKDRVDIASRRVKNPFRLLSIISNDSAKKDYMNYYFTERQMSKTKRI